MAPARQRLATVQLLALALLVAGCGSSAERQHGRPTLRLALPLIPATVDPARAGDLPSLNVSHELYAGLTRFSKDGVEPDLATSWDVEQGGLVWTFHLRKSLRWSDDRPLTAQDIRDSWLRALAPATKAPLAGPDLGIVRGARGYHATGRGEVGVQALDARTLRVTLQHPVPWLDQLVASPIAAAYRPNAYSGPFRLAGRRMLERNLNYWNVRKVKPAKLVLTTSTKGADAILPRGLAPPGLPWIETAAPPAGPGWTALPTLSVHLLWILTRRPALADPLVRADIAAIVGDSGLSALVPAAMPGRSTIVSGPVPTSPARSAGQNLSLGYTTQDPGGRSTALQVAQELSRRGFNVTPVAFPTLRGLVAAAGPPARADLDLVLLGWSAKVADQYNILDLFPCGSAFNVAHWCDPSYDALMRRAVRTLDDGQRYAIERDLLGKLRRAVPAVPLAGQTEWVHLRAGVHGFSWSPVGFYELDGLTRS